MIIHYFHDPAERLPLHHQAEPGSPAEGGFCSLVISVILMDVRWNVKFGNKDPRNEPKINCRISCGERVAHILWMINLREASGCEKIEQQSSLRQAHCYIQLVKLLKSVLY